MSEKKFTDDGWEEKRDKLGELGEIQTKAHFLRAFDAFSEPEKENFTRFLLSSDKIIEAFADVLPPPIYEDFEKILVGLPRKYIKATTAGIKKARKVSLEREVCRKELNILYEQFLAGYLSQEDLMGQLRADDAHDFTLIHLLNKRNDSSLAPGRVFKMNQLDNILEKSGLDYRIRRAHGEHIVHRDD